MNRLLTFAHRILALYVVRCLEIELHDQTEALQRVTDVPAFQSICAARQHTQRELLKARRHYLGLLKPGHCPTWRTA